MSYLKPFSSLYEKIAGFKNYLYNQEYFQSVELPIPVLSLGNLTVGGTGKTPLTDFCLKHYRRCKVKTAVVSRNYRAQVSGMTEVDLGHSDAAAYFGDEPVLLAARNPEVHFFVGPKKFKTALYAFEKVKPALIIIDDGFQHRQLDRDVDIVILDATEPLENYQCLPEGRAREPWSSLSRASLFVVSKVNLVDSAKLEKLYKELRKFNKLIVPMSYELLALHGFKGEIPLAECQGQRVMLISGIAQPKAFEKSLEAFSLQVDCHFVFRDHHPYSAADVASIVEKWREKGSPRLMTTEKDFVKLKALWPVEVPLWYAPLEVKIQSQENGFYEILDQVLR
ncbi:MAG TPA: tetraacyldisaccharide 4'-kinase [Pseudobdellovibrionaceae bacterium]|jgi:tetraacyldisaccharide 4'-kinase